MSGPIFMNSALMFIIYFGQKMERAHPAGYAPSRSLLKTCQAPAASFSHARSQTGGRTDNIGIAYITQQAHTMSAPALVEPALTLSAAILTWETQVPRAVDRSAQTDESTSIGARIASLRKERGLTQKELAERLAITQPVVSDYEHDVIRIPADVVVAIARVLDASADELLGLKREPRGTAGLKNRRLSRRLQAIDALPKRDQEALLRTIDAFISKTA
jgi:transcriptional regulator with XRE-family HTH domain